MCKSKSNSPLKCLLKAYLNTYFYNSLMLTRSYQKIFRKKKSKSETWTCKRYLKNTLFKPREKNSKCLKYPTATRTWLNKITNLSKKTLKNYSLPRNFLKSKYWTSHLFKSTRRLSNCSYKANFYPTCRH